MTVCPISNGIPGEGPEEEISSTEKSLVLTRTILLLETSCP